MDKSVYPVLECATLNCGHHVLFKRTMLDRDTDALVGRLVCCSQCGSFTRIVKVDTRLDLSSKEEHVQAS